VDAIATEAKAIHRSYEHAAKASPSKKHAEKLREKGRTVARTAAKQAAAKLRKEVDKRGSAKGIGWQTVTAEMRLARAEKPPDKKLPDVKQFVVKLTADLTQILSSKDIRWMKLNEIVKFRDDIDPDCKNNLTVALDRLIDRCQAMKDAINGERAKLKSS